MKLKTLVMMVIVMVMVMMVVMLMMIMIMIGRKLNLIDIIKAGHTELCPLTIRLRPA